jgi:hypothetical protein
LRLQEVVYQKPVRHLMTYFEHPRLTITIVAGDSLSRLEPRHEREVFLVRDAWYFFDPQRQIGGQRQIQNPDPHHIHYLSNTEEIHRIRLAHGFRSHYVNIGCLTQKPFRQAEQPPLTAHAAPSLR